MPSTLLTSQARHLYSTFPQDIDEHALARYFTLSARDHKAIGRCRGDHNRLGFACQLCWLRWLGWQPDSATSVPKATIVFPAHQLNVSPDHLAQYAADPRMWRRHTEQVREHLGWRRFGEAESRALADWLLGEAMQYNSGRGLLEAAISYLRREAIVRPGITTVERLVLSIRTKADGHLI